MDVKENLHDLLYDKIPKLRAAQFQVVWSKKSRRFVAQRMDTSQAHVCEPWRIVGVYRKPNPTLHQDITEDIKAFQLEKQRTTG